MAVSTVALMPQFEKSYRFWLRGQHFPDANIHTTIMGTLVILRRHSIHGTICSDCRNDDPNACQVTRVDKLGFITHVKCLVCNNNMSAACRKANYYFERIEDASVLVRGDHVGWYRSLSYWHHAIVTRQSADRVAVVGYTIRNNDGPCAKVRESVYMHECISSLTRGTLFRVIHEDCYTNEYAALRAERSIGEEKYDFFEQNCEHTTIWCKTGLHSSDQLQSCLTSLGKVALSVFLRAVVLVILWLLQLSYLSQSFSDTRGPVSVERGVTIAYMSLIVIIFVIYSSYKGCKRIKPYVEVPCREPHDDCMESFRKICTNGFFQCCCGGRPSCSRLTCSICFVSCFCCSLVDATCSVCAWKIRMCGVPCCGRPVSAVVRLVIRSFVRELVANSGAFLIVWFMDDIVVYFEDQGVSASADAVVNRAVIVIVALLVVSLVAYPVGVVLARWAEGMTECCCCPCSGPPKQAVHSHEKPAKKPKCPVHDVVMDIPASKDDKPIPPSTTPKKDYGLITNPSAMDDYRVITNIAVQHSVNKTSAVIVL